MGDFCVFKVAGAAAQRQAPMDEVERLATKANRHTRTLGVAFGGCSLPGSPEPLFSVDPDRMEIGLGIHGEPGTRSGPRVPAAALARLLVEPLLASAERPPEATHRAAVLVNGLGRTKYEELFVLYGDVAHLLEARGVQVIAPEVGELVTSLDMAGCSLTLFWLDEELEELWAAPVDGPGYRKTGTAPSKTPAPGSEPTSAVATPPPVAGGGRSPAESAERADPRPRRCRSCA